jgi:cytochrome P450
VNQGLHRREGVAGSEIVLTSYDDVREAFFDPNLSRSFDDRPFEDGNIREGVVSTAHGSLHRARRRLENIQFRPDVLRTYELDLSPPIVNGLLDRLIEEGSGDLCRIGNLLSLVLASRRVGLDVDPESLPQLELLDSEVDGLNQMSSILDSRDPEATRRIAVDTLERWERDFVGPSRERRIALIEEHGPASDELPNDLLTTLLAHRAEDALRIDDDGRITRELATYMVGGTTTTAQTLVNAVDLVMPLAESDPSLLTRIVDDRAFAQRCGHETLRLRPLTPRPKRYAEEDTTVGGTVIPKGSVVILAMGEANLDERVFGPTALAFDPDRDLPDTVSRWGLAFGAGAHQCPGRTVAGGFPVPAHGDLSENHLFGFVAIMLQEVVRRGIAIDPSREATADERTLRSTDRYPKWQTYPVTFDRSRVPVASA